MSDAPIHDLKLKKKILLKAEERFVFIFIIEHAFI